MLSGRFAIGPHWLMKTVFAMALMTVAFTAQAVQLMLISHKTTANGTTISTLFTDGTATMSSGAATTAAWDWDGTTLSSTGLFAESSTLGSLPNGNVVIEDNTVDLIIDTNLGTSTATGYDCIEGQFLAVVGASGCGGYSFNDGVSDSTSTWGPGLAIAQTIGGDDTSTPDGQRTVNLAYDGLSIFGVTGTGLNTGDTVIIGTSIPLGTLGADQIEFVVISEAEAVDDTAGGGSNVPINIDVLGNDSLTDDISALTTTTPSNGSTVINGVPGPAAGISIDYTSGVGFTGPATFDYTVTDNEGIPVSAMVTVTVTNQLPVANDDPGFASAVSAVGLPLDVLANDSLGDGPTATVDVTVAPTLGSITTTLPIVCSPPPTSGCQLDYNAPAAPGVDTFTYSLTDDNGDVDTAVVTVTTATGLTAVADNASTEINTLVNVDVLANDANLTSPTFSVDVTTLPVNGTINTTLPVIGCNVAADCALDYTPDPGHVGNDTFVYEVTDSDAPPVMSSATVTVFTNDIPVANDDPAETAVTEVATSLNVQANDTGLNDAPITVTVTGNPSNGTAVPDIGVPGNILYTSAAGFNGIDMFDYELDDNNGDTSGMATVTVAVNDIPGAFDDGSMGVPGLTLLPGETADFDVLNNDSGLSDTPLTVTLVNPAPTLGMATVTAGAAGCMHASTICIEYAAGQTPGTDSFGYQIMDASGDTDTATAFVGVVSGIPMAIDDTDSTFAGVTVLTDVLANDQGMAATDLPVFVTITGVPPVSGMIGSVQGCAAPGSVCEVSYIPNAGFTGTDTYQYFITDTQGDTSNTATVTITVDEVPVAVDDTAMALEDASVDIDVLANDGGLGFPPLTVLIETAPLEGTAVVLANNNIRYTAPGGGVADEDAFVYRVNDANLNTSTAIVTISIDPNQNTLPGKKSTAVGPAGLGLLALIVWLRRRRFAA